MVSLPPRAPGDSVRPRRLAGVVVRPLNFTVSLTGKSSVRTRSQQFNLATVVLFAWDPELKIYATTKPQRAVQASLERTRVRLRLRQQFSPGAPSTDPHLRQLKGCAPVPAPQAVKLTNAWSGP